MENVEKKGPAAAGWTGTAIENGERAGKEIENGWRTEGREDH